jgi:signal recognition particle GTPase
MLKEFEQMQDMMKKMKGGGLMKLMKKHGRHERARAAACPRCRSDL